jgi:glycosyltransferase involved in cell wall biosynthesis
MPSNAGGTTKGRVLIVSYYFPPAGGGGVQRVLKLCKHLPELGWEVEVLAPDDPKWVAHDPDLEAAVPDGVIVHRARYRGPSHARSSSERLASAKGWRGIGTRGAVVGRKLLLPDAAVLWAPGAARAAVRIVRERKIDLVLTSSPPSSVHIVGNRVTRRTGIPWIADFRDSWLANPHRRYERRSVRAKRKILEQIAHRTLKPVAGVTAVTEVIRAEAAGYAPPGTPTRVISNGCDFDDFAHLRHSGSERLRIVHAGYFFGARSPRPFLEGLRRVLDQRPDLRGLIEARFIGGFRASDRAWAESLQLGDALRIDGFVPHSEALRAMKEADALLLLIPTANGLGNTVLSGKIFEYLAAERPVVGLVPPDGAAAELLRQTGFAWIADPDDVAEISSALADLGDTWRSGGLVDRTLPGDVRERIDRRARAAEMDAIFTEVR